MKLNILSGLGAKIAAHKKLSVAILFLLLIGLAAAGWYGFKEYQYRQSSLYAMERIKKALMPPDPNELAHLVDFNAISQELAQAIRKNFPFYMEGPDQERSIRNRLQAALLKHFLNKEDAKAAPLPDSEEQLLALPVKLLPADFVPQLLASMSLLENGTDTAHIGAKVENPLLKKTFPLIFSMRKTGEGWKISHLANADELVSQINTALLDRHARLRTVYEDKNDKTAKRMEQLLPILSCSADAGLLSDGKTLLMVVQLIARNRGNVQINNFNVDASISGRGGREITQRFLNVAKPIAPGEDFNHRWNFELEAGSPLGKAILAGRPLQCKASWQTLGLNNSEVLHILEVPNPDRECHIDGHNHPDGFCTTPLFAD